MIEKIKELINWALALLEKVLAILRLKLACFESTSPPGAPKLWIYINGASCIVTGMFFLLGCLDHNTYVYHLAEIFYIPCNLLFCLLWVFEAAGWMIFDEEEPAWHKLPELLLAGFFILDGIAWVYEWAFTDLDLERKEILIYAAIDFFIYGFYLVLAIKAEAKKSLAEGGPEKGEGDVEATAVPPSDQKEAKAEAKTEFKLMT